MNPKDQERVAAMAATAMGEAPKNPPTESAPPTTTQNSPPSEGAKPTEQEQATTDVSPKTEGDKAGEESVSYIRIKEGDKERVLSEAQVAQMLGRYRDLNFRHQSEVAPIEPALRVLQEIYKGAKEKNPDITGDDLAQFLKAQVMAGQKNPTLGNQEDTTPDTKGTKVDMDEILGKWEEENSVDAGPLREGFKSIQQTQSEMAQLKAMMAELLNGMKGVATTSQQMQADARSREGNAMAQSIANNLNQAQQAAGLPDDSADDFWIFAQERGFIPEDFADAALAKKVVGDFKAIKDQPDMERLRAIHERRQSFTGTMGSTPNAPGGATTPAPGQETFNGLVDHALKGRQ